MAFQFQEVALEWGVDFVVRSSFDGTYRLPENSCGGVGLFDANGDGRVDLYLVDAGELRDSTAKPGVDRIYLNAGGRFRDVTEAAGIRRSAFGMGIAAADVDSDGDVDVYLTSLGADEHFENDGAAAFTRQSDSDVADGWSTSASFFDFDRDGDLDLYVARYVEYSPSMVCRGPTSKLDFCGPDAYPHTADAVFMNAGAGRFKDASDELGIARALGAGLGVIAEDFDDDGWLDVFVANDLGPNRLWSNDSGQHFRDVAPLVGVAFDLQGRPEASMGIVADDLDGDARIDLFLTHLRTETNTLYRATGNPGRFIDATSTTNTARTSLPMTGFGIDALDADLDGDLDLLIANGSVLRNSKPLASDLAEPWNEYAEEDHLLENLGSGRFATPLVLGPSPSVSRGSAHGDLDGDGRVDWVVNSVESRARVFLNRVPPQRSFVGLDVRTGLRSALGARVSYEFDGVGQVRTVRRDGSFLATQDPRIFLAAPDSVPFDVTVRFVDGTAEVFTIHATDRIHTLVQGEGR